MIFNDTKQTVAERTRTTNFEGGEAFEPEDSRLALYKVTINNLLEDSYYESDEESFEKVQERFEACAEEHPEFVLQLAAYARDEMFLRQVPQLLLVLSANHSATKPYVREYAMSIMQRADEPLEALAMQVTLFGKSIPNPLQKGIEDALHQFDEYQFAKWDSNRKEFSYRDLMNLVHPRPRDDERAEIFERIVRGPLDSYPDVEPLTQHRTWENERSSDTTIETFTLGVDEVTEKRQGIIRLERRETEGGLSLDFGEKTVTGEKVATIEATLTPMAEMESTILDSRVSVDDGESTVTVTVEADLTDADEYRHRLPDMGLMAKVRNVRNMLQAGLAPEEILNAEDLDAVEYVKMYPFRYYTAYKALKPKRGMWGDPVGTDLSTTHTDQWFEQAIDKSVAHVPDALEDTYVSVDLSGSMDSPLSENSKMTMKEISALFGGITAKMGADVSAFATEFTTFDFHSMTPTLQMTDNILDAEIGGGTNGHLPIDHLIETDTEYENVVIFTDMQMWSRGSTNGMFGRRRTQTSLKETWDRYTEEVAPDANLYVIDLTSYGDLVTPEGYPNVYNVSGWTEEILKHIKYASQPGEIIAEIEAIEP